MVDSEFSAFCEFLRGACEQYGKPPLSEFGLNVMFRALRDLPLTMVFKGIISHVRNNRYTPPNAGSIRDYAFGSPEDRAREAYGLVMQALRKVNVGESIRFVDPCIHWALSQGFGGWTGFARISADKAQEIFVKFYVTAVHLGKAWGDDGVADYLPGEREIRGSILNPWSVEQIVDWGTPLQPKQKCITANCNIHEIKETPIK